MKLEPKHWAVIAGLITGLATQLLSAQHGWTDITTPGFVAGLLIQVASAISAIFVGAPGASAALDQANRNTDMANESVRAALDPPPDPAKLDPKRFIGTGAVLLACVLGASGCGPKQFHTAVVANTSIAQAIFAVQDAEIAAHNGGLITADNHTKYKAQILTLLQAGDDLTLALKDWNPSQPVPANVGVAIGNVQRLLSDLQINSPQATKLLATVATVLSVLRGTGVLPVSGRNPPEAGLLRANRSRDHEGAPCMLAVSQDADEGVLNSFPLTFHAAAATSRDELSSAEVRQVVGLGIEVADRDHRGRFRPHYVHTHALILLPEVA